MKNAQSIHAAMVDLKQGKITPDEFRAIMRASRQRNGEAEHDRAKGVALSNFERA
jgi:hypothetical protein